VKIFPCGLSCDCEDEEEEVPLTGSPFAVPDVTASICRIDRVAYSSRWCSSEETGESVRVRRVRSIALVQFPEEHWVSRCTRSRDPDAVRRRCGQQVLSRENAGASRTVVRRDSAAPQSCGTESAGLHAASHEGHESPHLSKASLLRSVVACR